MTSFILGFLAAWTIFSILIDYSDEHDLGISVFDVNLFVKCVLLPFVLIYSLFCVARIFVKILKNILTNKNR